MNNYFLVGGLASSPTGNAVPVGPAMMPTGAANLHTTHEGVSHMNESEFRMPFGKFRGVKIGEIETSYLKWLATIELREPLKSAVAAALTWKAVPVHPVGSTPMVQPQPERGATALLGASKGVSGASPSGVAPKPKRAWIPRQEDLSQYYTPQGVDDIGF